MLKSSRINHFISLLPLLYYHSSANASLIGFFKDEQGETKWQYVANFSSGVLIILLSITAITLFFSQRKAHQANRALENIRDKLEQRVQERTATLDEYNKLLKQTNMLLEGEMSQHKETASQLQSSESYINNILESMPLMLIGLNEEKTVTHWNQMAELITGVNSQHAIGKNLWEAYPTITLSPDQIASVMEDKKPITIKHSQRGQYYFDITIYPLKEQVVNGLVILIDNVTQRKLAENMLIQRDKMSSIGELASNMAHDIDAPLQAIMHDIQAAKSALSSLGDASQHTDASVRIAGLLADAADRSKQTLAIVNNLLDFSRAYGDKKRLANIVDIIEHTIDLASDVLSEPSGLKFRDITIERQYGEDLPDIPCYAAELQQVFLSLFRHASHAIGEVKQDNLGNFTPLIKVELAYHYDALWIKVHHNGIGLTIEEQQTIFEPFFVNHANKNVNAEKGLSFSNFIITEHHQGQIAVTSDPDAETTFHIQLSVD